MPAIPRVNDCVWREDFFDLLSEGYQPNGQVVDVCYKHKLVTVKWWHEKIRKVDWETYEFEEFRDTWDAAYKCWRFYVKA